MCNLIYFNMLVTSSINLDVKFEGNTILFMFGLETLQLSILIGERYDFQNIFIVFHMKFSIIFIYYLINMSFLQLIINFQSLKR